MYNSNLNLSFPHNYEVEVLESLPSNLPRERQIFFPKKVEGGGKDGIIVKVTPLHLKPWVGIFAFGYKSPRALTQVFSCPNELYVCVVSAVRDIWLKWMNHIYRKKFRASQS